MKRNEFINKIEDNLKAFDQSEINEIINYYNEIIADKMDLGLTEDEAINSLGDVKDITNEIKTNILMKRTNKKSTNSLKNFLIILGICSTPILLPIGITFAVLYFTLYIVLFSFVIAFGASGIAVIFAFLLESVRTLSTSGELSAAFIQLGIGFILGAILLLLTVISIKITKVLLNGTNKFFIKIIRKRSKKGDELND